MKININYYNNTKYRYARWCELKHGKLDGKSNNILYFGKITLDMIVLLDKWRYTGFNVFSGPRILPR